LARIAGDPGYLRALFGWLWLAVPGIGVAVGLAAARNTSFEVIMPSLALCLVLVAVGTFDAFAGFFAVSAFGLSVLVAGGINSPDAIRGLLGLAVFSFAVPLSAAAVRPFRRVNKGIDDVWNRVCDAVLIPLFGAWSAGAMFAALPGLTGFKPEYADEIGSVRLVVLLSLVARWLLENAARLYTPRRLDEIENDHVGANWGLRLRSRGLHRQQLGVVGWWCSVSGAQARGTRERQLPAPANGASISAARTVPSGAHVVCRQVVGRHRR
jgi:hypothetical protein